MKIRLALLCLSAATAPAWAALSSRISSPLVVVALPQPRTVAVSLTLPASLVSVPLQIISDQKNTAAAYNESHQAVEMIAQKVAENGQFRLSRGVIALSERK